MNECPRCKALEEIRVNILSRDANKIQQAKKRIIELAMFSDFFEGPRHWHSGLSELLFGKRAGCETCSYPIGEGKKARSSGNVSAYTDFGRSA